jgi:hypothetical protein
MKRSRVFIGPMEVANVAKSISVALRTQKIDAEFVTYSISLHPFDYKSEKVLFFYEKSPLFGLNRILKYYYLIRNILRYNTFIFLSPESLLPKNKDLPLLKFLKKRMIFIFTGCAERDTSFQLNDPDFICNRCEDKNWQQMFLCHEIDKKRKRVEKFEMYSNYIISQPDSAAYLKEKVPIWFYVIAEPPPEKDYVSKFNKDRIVISHLPSNPLVKQTDIIVPVLKRIGIEYNVEIIIKDGIWSRENILSVLDKTHILVDALGLGYAVLAVEAMSRGCIVMNSFNEWFRVNTPEAPVFRTTAKTLYTDIVSLLNNQNIMKEYSRRSIEYYKNYHTPEVVGKFYKDKLDLH